MRLTRGGELREPDVSPLHAHLGGLPPAIFTVGTRDPPLDDTLFMAPRRLAAGNETEAARLPGRPARAGELSERDARCGARGGSRTSWPAS
ncbi:MAG: alpha/beta hydrolase [Xanthobacteraceae bacterium]|nr:alpha/beta hydrolase [Xanthobacteraceae bacterium]